jgi:hypothetical protein
MCPVRSVTYVSGPDPRLMERAMGIEPTSEAWEASILPLYDARSDRSLRIAPAFRCVQDLWGRSGPFRPIRWGRFTSMLLRSRKLSCYPRAIVNLGPFVTRLSFSCISSRPQTPLESASSLPAPQMNGPKTGHGTKRTHWPRIAPAMCLDGGAARKTGAERAEGF